MSIASAKGVLFDYGGTLDTNGDHWGEVLWQAYMQCGVPVSKEIFREAYVFGERTMGKSPLIGPADDFHRVLQVKIELQLQYLTREIRAVEASPAMQLEWMHTIEKLSYNRVTETINNLSRPLVEALSLRYPLLLVSNFYGNMQVVLREFGLLPYFQSIVESSVVGLRKPSPAIFSLGVERLGLQPCEVCVVGDSFDKDILPAHSLGCSTVWLKGHGWSDAPVDESLPTAVITSISQLTPLLLS